MGFFFGRFWCVSDPHGVCFQIVFISFFSGYLEPKTTTKRTTKQKEQFKTQKKKNDNLYMLVWFRSCACLFGCLNQRINYFNVSIYTLVICVSDLILIWICIENLFFLLFLHFLLTLHCIYVCVYVYV